MIEAMRSTETSVLIRATWHNIPKDGILLMGGLFCNSCRMDEKRKIKAEISETVKRPERNQIYLLVPPQ
jgi:hypothetical protein